MSSSTHHKGSVNAVEGYNSRKCHQVTHHHSPPFNIFLILRLEDKDIFEGLGHVRDLTSLTPHIGRV
jgi:hypothetical protein